MHDQLVSLFLSSISSNNRYDTLFSLVQTSFFKLSICSSIASNLAQRLLTLSLLTEISCESHSFFLHYHEKLGDSNKSTLLCVKQTSTDNIHDPIDFFTNNREGSIVIVTVSCRTNGMVYAVHSNRTDNMSNYMFHTLSKTESQKQSENRMCFII